MQHVSLLDQVSHVAHISLYSDHIVLFIGCVDMIVRSPVPPPNHWKGDLKGLCYEVSLVIFVGMSFKN